MAVTIVSSCTQLSLTEADTTAIDLNTSFGANTPPKWYLSYLSYNKANTHAFAIEHSADNTTFVPLIETISASSNHTSSILTFSRQSTKVMRYIRLVPSGSGALNLTLQFE